MLAILAQILSGSWEIVIVNVVGVTGGIWVSSSHDNGFGAILDER
ncbi:MAG TPA: hypothetical protein VGL22_06745 [Terracidiphilus sp.]